MTWHSARRASQIPTVRLGRRRCVKQRTHGCGQTSAAAAPVHERLGHAALARESHLRA